MSDSAPTAPPDSGLRRFREYVAAGIAGLVVAGTFVMLIAAFWYMDNNESFARVKDLLLIVNPFMGVVIGYYFSKVSTEARAESAESTARSATANAQQAMNEAQQSSTARVAAEEKVQTVTSALADVQAAAEQVLTQSPAPASGVLGAESAPAGDDGRAALRAALERARRVTGK